MLVWGQAAWPQDGTSGVGGAGLASIGGDPGQPYSVLAPGRWDPYVLSIPLVSPGFTKCSRIVICSEFSHTLTSHNRSWSKMGGEEGLV